VANDQLGIKHEQDYEQSNSYQLEQIDSSRKAHVPSSTSVFTITQITNKEDESSQENKYKLFNDYYLVGISKNSKSDQSENENGK
jgi:hypothetical protein